MKKLNCIYANWIRRKFHLIRNFIGFAGLKYLDDLDEVDLGYRLIKKH